MSEGLEVTVYDRVFASRRWVTPVRATVNPRHNAQPTASLTVAWDDVPARSALSSPGARVVVRMGEEHLLSGPVRTRGAAGIGGQRLATFEVTDDWWLLRRVLLWPVPAAAITNQSSSAYHVVSGPAETVAKTLLGAAIARLGLPVTVAEDLGRGDTISVSARMSQPADLLLPLLDNASLGLTVRQQGAGLVLDAYTPTTWPITLSELGGTVTGMSWSIRPPDPTRVVLGAGGEGTARAFRARVDSTAETLWDVAESFLDARDLDPGAPGFEAAATARMQAALDAGRLRSGISLSLSESAVFRYGGAGVHVGDRVRVDLSDDEEQTPISDVIREAQITWGEDGLTVTPVVGDRSDDPDQALAAALADTMRHQRESDTRR